MWMAQGHYRSRPPNGAESGVSYSCYLCYATLAAFIAQDVIIYVKPALVRLPGRAFRSL
jgi:hypothetical protein